MLSTGWQKSYYDYLTEKLDKGAKNIVVDITTRTIVDRLKTTDGNIRVADLGCFTGSILNRVYTNLPDKFKRRTSLFGLDNDKKILKLAAKQRPHIKFIESDLSKHVLASGPFDIIIVSNVLHEIYSTKLPNKINARQSVLETLTRMAKILSPKGYLVLLDGVLPENSRKLVKVKFIDQEFLKEFRTFAKSNYISPIKYKTLDNYVIQTNTQNLATFLTKSRYLKEKYWNNEAKQIYQYFTVDEFRKILLSLGIEIETAIPQPVTQIESKIKILTTNVKIPPKNVLIKARKLARSQI